MRTGRQACMCMRIRSGAGIASGAAAAARSMTWRRCCGIARRAVGTSSSCAASWRGGFDELAGVGGRLWDLGWRGGVAAEAAAEFEVLAVGGGERRLEPGELGAVVALELG